MPRRRWIRLQVSLKLGVEAKWSAISWRRWCGDHTLALAPRTGRVLPPWLAMPFVQRASGLGATGPRHATDPINAMLNIAYAKEAGRLGARLAVAGACLAIGFLHCDKLNRHSMVYDALEPLRPLIDARILKFVREHRFDRGDFFRLKGGYVRMHSGLIRVLLEKSALPEADLSQASEFMLNLIQNRPKRPRRKASRPTNSEKEPAQAAPTRSRPREVRI
jgi:CRISPR associated protein Cas1